MRKNYSVGQMVEDIKSIDRDLSAIRHFRNELEQRDEETRAKIYGMLAGPDEKLPETILNSTESFLMDYRELLKHVVDTTTIKWPPDVTAAE